VVGRGAPSSRTAATPEHWLFAGPGEMRERVRELDWSRTALGPIARWPQALRVLVDALLASAIPTVLLWGPDLIQIYNDAHATLIGRKHPRALGMPTHECWPNARDVNEPLYARVRAGETLFMEDTRFVLERDGVPEEGYFTASYSPVHGDDGAVDGVLVVLVEMTLGNHTQEMQADRERLVRELQVERSRLEQVNVQLEQRAAELRASEQRLRDLFEQAPLAVAVLTGPEHIYTIASPRYVETPGGGRPLLGRSVRDAFPELVGKEVIEAMDRVYETGVPYFANERPVTLDPNGDGTTEDRYFNLGYQPLRNAAGEVYAIASVAYEVTEQMRARHDLEIAKEAAEEARVEAVTANQAKSAFLTTMSHELRTPLNAVSGYSDLLLMGVRGPLTDGQRADLERIKRSGQYLLGLINDVLNVAKLDAGQVDYHFEDVRLAPLLDGLEELIRPQVDAKGLRYTHGACPADTVIRADPEKTQQILLNLLTNAVKFTEAGGDVSLTCASEADVVHVTVQDTGRGIAAEQLTRVFDPFVQVDRHLTPMSQQGVGLGLAISRDLALGMGGSLGAMSAVGVGSEFTLTLPRASNRTRG
jgi:signal transduction histidine kinase